METTTTISINLTKEQADELSSLLCHSAEDLSDRLDMYGDINDKRYPDDHQEIVDIYKPMRDVADQVLELLSATPERKPGAHVVTCPRCGQTNEGPDYLLEHTGSDAWCAEEEERQYSCQNCGCLFDEVWAYSRTEVTRDPTHKVGDRVEFIGADYRQYTGTISAIHGEEADLVGITPDVDGDTEATLPVDLFNQRPIPPSWCLPGVILSPFTRDPNDEHYHCLVYVRIGAERAKVYHDHDTGDWYVYLVGADPDRETEYALAFDECSTADVASAIARWAGGNR